MYIGQHNWNQNGDIGHNRQNPYGYTPGSGAGGGCGRGGHVGGVRQDVNHSRVRGVARGDWWQ